MKVYKFSNTATSKCPEITAKDLIDQMKTKNVFTFGTQNLMSEGIFKINGWAFDISDQLKLFLVKQYGQWHEVYAPNRTTVRKLTYGRIEAIQEVMK